MTCGCIPQVQSCFGVFAEALLGIIFGESARAEFCGFNKVRTLNALTTNIPVIFFDVFICAFKYSSISPTSDNEKNGWKGSM
jgi:hypothetical protein